MNLLSPIEDKRRIVPRWRNFRKTTFTGELSTFNNSTLPSNVETSPYLLDYLERWSSDPGIDTAAEIVFHCTTLSRPELAIEQATYLSQHASSLTGNLNDLLTQILDGRPTEYHPIVSPVEYLCDLNQRIYSEIHRLKNVLNRWPGNAVYWVEIARLYAALGENTKADKAIKISLQLSPANRYILRSAIRFYLHTNELEKITKLFSQYDALYSDPWVLASYVALHDVLRKKNFRIKSIRNLISNSSDSQVTELAGALATLELDSGAVKSAKRLFNTSIIHPNDNSLAQIAWAETHIGDITDISKIHLLFDHEARTRDYFRTNEITKSIDSCIQWIIDEPFSSLPATVGSYIASMYAADYECAKQFCEVGLNANPMDKMLLNNYAVCLARTGDLLGAIDSLKRIGTVEEDSPMYVTFLATTGLIQFRSGLYQDARDSYTRSMSLAKKLNLPIHKAVAAINLVEEEIVVDEIAHIEIKNILVNNIGNNLPKEIDELASNVINKLVT